MEGAAEGAQAISARAQWQLALGAGAGGGAGLGAERGGSAAAGGGLAGELRRLGGAWGGRAAAAGGGPGGAAGGFGQALLVGLPLTGLVACAALALWSLSGPVAAPRGGGGVGSPRGSPFAARAHLSPLNTGRR